MPHPTKTKQKKARPTATVDGIDLYPVPGRPGIYVTADGRDVYQKRSAKDPRGETKEPVQLSTGINQHGYPYAVINSQPVAVHPLVCRAFHGERPGPKHVVARQNGNKTDNRPENLKWAMPCEVMREAFQKRNPPTERERAPTRRKKP